MANLEVPMFLASLIFLGFSFVLSLWRYLAGRSATMETADRQTTGTVSASGLPNILALATMIASILCLTLSLVARATFTGHGPFSSRYEFATAFAWGILVVGLFFWWRYRLIILSIIGIVVASGLLIYAYYQPSQAAPLVPALQQSWLLTTHVASAVISYGAFTVGFAAAIVYLIRNRKMWRDKGDEPDILDEISYTSVKIGFPFMTLVIILGALWADIAWGRYWSWDPKETASLVTWLLYAAYLHARVMRGWRGRRAAILLIIGFAAVIFTFFGNYIFSGLHAYG
jgi:cytochrome c-type biogenesis protein CcsB